MGEDENEGKSEGESKGEGEVIKWATRRYTLKESRINICRREVLRSRCMDDNLSVILSVISGVWSVVLR